MHAIINLTNKNEFLSIYLYKLPLDFVDDLLKFPKEIKLKISIYDFKGDININIK